MRYRLTLPVALLLSAAVVLRAADKADSKPAHGKNAPAASEKDAPAKSYYMADFEGKVGKEWSNRKTSKTPNGERRFLGEFSAEKLALKLKNLPEHKLVTLRFRLLIIRSWDGYHPHYGPDTWTLSVERGPTLLATSFSHPTHGGDQAYPGWHGEDKVKSATGALATDFMGYEFGAKPCDAEYVVQVTFPHVSHSLILNFEAALNTVGRADESWGLDDVRVELSNTYESLDTDVQTALIKQLTDESPTKAYPAYWRLAAAGPAAADAVKAMAGKNPADRSVEELIQQLQSRDFKKREDATRQLIAMGPAVRQPLEAAAGQTDLPPEQRERIQLIIEKLRKSRGVGAEQLRYNRATRLLKLIEAGTKE
ncbi:MAG: hypothetical protein GVY16_11145 [Planctomycetes bacterium]|jgi:hypothetical protein|nr:hypothetical protein [Planctomycetota bacterium]